MKSLPKQKAGSVPTDPMGISRRRRTTSVETEPNVEALYRSLLDGLPEMVFRKDVTGRYTFANRSLCEWLGRSADAILGKTDHDLLPAEAASPIAQDDERFQTGGGSEPLVGVYDVPGLDPSRVRITRIPVRDRQGGMVGYHGIVTAPTDERVRALEEQTMNLLKAYKLMEEQLARQAFYDPLTNLPNRALFMNRIDHLFHRAVRQTTERPCLFALLCVDVDRFKSINDSLGHEAGDECLAQVARRIESCLRPSDTMARLGQDDFAILLEDLRDAGDATVVAERIHDQLRVPCQVVGADVYASVSIGIALSTFGYGRPEDMIRDADTAMCRAKANGRSRHVVFEAGMHDRAVSQFRIETDLRLAFKRQEFVVYYQPIVDIEDNRLVGFEALVRWQHPQRGLLAPATFLPAAEEAGLIGPLSLWVLEEACRQVRLWRDLHPGGSNLRVSVNMSSHLISQPDVIERVRHALAAAAVDPSVLTIEITESFLMQNLDVAAAILAELRAMSIQIEIDDFGTGYSSLSYLQNLPVDALKIDHSFVSGMQSYRGQSEIVQAIVRLAHSLGMKVIAEGVETREQLEALRAIRCNGAQGFLFARPLPPDEAERLIANGLPVV